MADLEKEPVFPESGEDVDLEGGESSVQHAVPTSPQEEPLNTLDEPIMTTIGRDVKRVAVKLRYVLFPRKSSSTESPPELRDWDLWGPLLLCVCLSSLLSYGAPLGQSSLVFASVFTLVWCGAGIVALNAKLLGGTISFFQSVCVQGYCIGPICIAAVLCLLWSNIVYRLLITVVCLVWASRASVVFLAPLVPESRRVLAAYPVILLFIVLSWMVLASN